MYSPQVDPVLVYREGEKARAADHVQAIGWRLDKDVQGRTYINHTGTVRGIRPFIMNYREYDFVLALQANVVPFDSREQGSTIAHMFLRPVHPPYRRSPSN